MSDKQSPERPFVTGQPSGDFTVEFDTGWRTVSRDDAERLLVALDDQLHRWGKPGEVPAEPGEYWLYVGVDDAVYGDVVISLASNGAPEVSRDGQGWGHEASARLAKAYQWRFRRRWTPEGPR